MSFLLRDDACRDALRQRPRVVARVTRHRGNLHVSALTILGLEQWLVLPQTPSALLPGYGTFRAEVRILDVTDDIARRAAGLWSRLRLGGHRLRDSDLLIAATALVHGLTLVTHATTVYANIPGLTVEDWTRP
jgi:tRNA(fMet)-specific endonuclease VapC